MTRQPPDLSCIGLVTTLGGLVGWRCHISIPGRTRTDLLSARHMGNRCVSGLQRRSRWNAGHRTERSRGNVGDPKAKCIRPRRILLDKRGLAAKVWSLNPCNHVEEEPRIPRPNRIAGKIRSIHPYSGGVVDPF
jgi:hypothetical protein